MDQFALDDRNEQEEDNVLFLYNPLEKVIISKEFKNICEPLLEEPGEIHIIYNNSVYL